jgi:hypothetical protein
MMQRNLVVDLTSFSTASYLELTTQLQFHTIIQIDEIPGFTVPEVTTKLASLADTLPESFQLKVPPYKPDATDKNPQLPQMALDQLRVVHHIIHGWDLTDPVMLVTLENAGNMANGTHHTHRTCLKGPDKEKWMEA